MAGSRQAGRLVRGRAGEPLSTSAGWTRPLAGIRQAPDVFAGGGVWAGQRALCLAHMGRVTEARDILHRFLSRRDMSRPDDPTSAAVLRYLLEASVVAGDKDAAGIFEARMAPLAGLLHTEADMCYCIGRLCGGAAVLLGEPEKARGLLSAGHRRLHPCPLPA